MAFLPEWRGRQNTAPARFAAWCLISFALHLPLTPLAVLAGLLTVVGATTDAAPPSEPITAIPVDLLTEEGDEQAGAGVREAPPPEAPPSEAPAAQVVASDLAAPTRAPDAGAPLDAGEDAPEADAALEGDAGPRLADAEVGDAGLDTDAGAPAADAGDAGRRNTIADPVALAGGAAKIADPKASIKLNVYSANVRGHPLGKRVGRLLSRLPQWSDFFGPTGIDPVQGLDRLMIWGPDFRDSSNLVVVLKHNLPDERMREAVDKLVSRSQGGGWLDAGVPSARARADRAERVIVMPGPGWVVVVPPSAEAAALQIRKPNLPPAKGQQALVGSLVKPYWAFKNAGVPFEIPKSIQEVRFEVTPTADGGGIGTFIAKDASAADAERSFRVMNEQIQKVRGLGILGAIFGGGITTLVGQIQLELHGDEIHGSLIASQAQVEGVLAHIEGQFGIPPLASTPPRGGARGSPPPPKRGAHD